MHFRLTAIALAFFAFLATGCGTSDAPEPAAQGEAAPQVATAAADGKADAGNVELAILDYEEIQELIASKRGKVVVVDAWSTSCPPCMKDFHNLVELDQEYDDGDVACISLSFDYEGIGQPEDVKEPVERFLKTQGAMFDNVMSNEESDALYRKFELNSVPAIFVYDRAGKLQKRFEDEGAYEEARPLVAELVKQPAPNEASGDGQ